MKNGVKIEEFGEDGLGLNAPTTTEILGFLRKYSADAELSEAAFKIRKSIPLNVTP